LTGQGDDADHNAVGAAVNTISSNLPEMAKGVRVLAAIMDDEGANGEELVNDNYLIFLDWKCFITFPNFAYIDESCKTIMYCIC